MLGSRTGMDVDDGVVGYISNMNNEIVKEAGMETIKKWQNAVAANGAFYPRLRLGADVNASRALMLSIPTGIQQYKLGYVDADGYKAYIKMIGDLFLKNSTINQVIVPTYERLIASIDNSTTVEQVKAVMNETAQFIPNEYKKVANIFLDGLTFSAIIRDYKRFRNARSTVVAAFEVPPEPVNEDGDVDPSLNAATAAAEEESWVVKVGTFGLGEAITGIASAATLVFTSLEIVDTVNLEKQLTSNIAHIRDQLKMYYPKLIKTAPALPGNRSY